MKSHVKAVTLAIGDGANDVSMIKCKSVVFIALKPQECMLIVTRV